MTKTTITAKYNELNFILRIVLQLLLGALLGGIYRIIRFVETRKTSTLVAGILALIPPVDFVFWIVDLVTLILNKKYTLFVD